MIRRTVLCVFLALAAAPPAAEAVFLAPSAGSPFGTGGNGADIALADLNQDGNLDYAEANANPFTVGNNGTTSTRHGDGAGGFGTIDVRVTGANTTQSIALGDVNNDGRIDALAGATDAKVTRQLNSSGRLDGGLANIALGDDPIGVATGDLNGDGKLDFVVADPALATNNVIVRLGNGDGNFSTPTPGAFSVTQGARRVALGDFNGDGRLDAAVVSDTTTANLAILLGNGAGGFTPALGSPLTVGGSPESVAVGDFNADGRPDLVVGPSSTATRVWLGNGSGGFAAAAGSVPNTAADRVGTGDFDGDGDYDFVAGSSAGQLHLALSDGAGGFTAAPGSPFTTSGVTGLDVGDLNGDGKPDVVTIGSSNVTALLNQSAAAAALSTDALAFGSQPRGTTSDARTVTLSNSGERAMRVDRVATTGAAAGDFLTAADGCTGELLPAGASCALRVRFAPTAEGDREATLEFVDDAPGSPHAVALSGVGAAPPTTGPGPQGQQGPAGPQGPAGERGRPGRDARVRCKPRKRRRRKIKVVCVVRFTPATRGSLRARLTRGGLVYARGHGRARDGRAALRLRPVRRLTAGRYRLHVRGRGVQIRTAVTIG